MVFTPDTGRNRRKLAGAVEDKIAQKKESEWRDTKCSVDKKLAVHYTRLLSVFIRALRRDDRSERHIRACRRRLSW